MTSLPVNPQTADANLFLPADGLSLLGEHQAGGHAGRQFLVGLSDGQVIQLPLLLYLIMAAVAEGSVDGGWSAEQVGARVGGASGQGLTADNVRYLIAGKLTPLGLIAADGADRRDGAPVAAGRVLRRPIAGRVGRLPLRYRRRRWALALAGTAVLVSVAAAAPIMAGTGSGSRERGGTSSAPPTPSASAAAASRSQAAAWVAQQVSQDVTVSCDPGMCRQLQRDGFPAARLNPLPGSARGPLTSGVVVATAAIRSQLGSRLATAYAPQVIASFGSGVAQVTVRTIAPDGAAAFRAQVAAETTALASAGRQLLGNKNFQASPAARTALRAGQVDARLLPILALLSSQMPVRLVNFTGAPGAGPGAPLRAAEISVTSTASRSAVLALLDAQQNPYRPAVAVADGGGSRPMIVLQFDAPASLNLSQP
jgi:hypothetical protein